MKRRILILSALMASAPAIAQDTLTEAFVVQCEHVMQCGLKKMKLEPNANQDMIQMIETQMAGKCQAQAEKISQAGQSPYADKMKACFQALTEMSCQDLEAGVKPSACENVN